MTKKQVAVSQKLKERIWENTDAPKKKDKMSVISFLILKNLKRLQDLDKQNKKETGLLRKSAEKTAKNILRIKSENRNG